MSVSSTIVLNVLTPTMPDTQKVQITTVTAQRRLVAEDTCLSRLAAPH